MSQANQSGKRQTVASVKHYIPVSSLLFISALSLAIFAENVTNLALALALYAQEKF